MANCAMEYDYYRVSVRSRSSAIALLSSENMRCPVFSCKHSCHKNHRGHLSKFDRCCAWEKARPWALTAARFLPAFDGESPNVVFCGEIPSQY